MYILVAGKYILKIQSNNTIASKTFKKLKLNNIITIDIIHEYFFSWKNKQR